VGKLVAHMQTFPEGARGQAWGERRSDLVFCDNSANACHYLFDSLYAKKVVRVGESAHSLHQSASLSRATARPNRDVFDRHTSVRFGIDRPLQSRLSACHELF